MKPRRRPQPLYTGNLNPGLFAGTFSVCSQDPNTLCYGLGAHSNDIQGASPYSPESENPLKEFRLAARDAWHR